MDRLTKIGDVRAKSAREVKTSRLGIGFEKLDRAVFDPEKAYAPLAKIGVKYVRIQSGWQRTEREKGKYDFSWLDGIVDRLISDGMIPWMNIVYGNELYDERAAEAYGAVGCPPLFSDEAFEAWIAYVRALVAHFRGRVRDYEIWNEPRPRHLEVRSRSARLCASCHSHGSGDTRMRSRRPCAPRRDVPCEHGFLCWSCGGGSL